MKYFKDVRCIRLGNNLKINWRNENIPEVRVYVGDCNCEKLLGKITNGSEFVFKDPNVNKRSIFILKAEGYHYEMVGEVLIPFKGVHHFRDIGGYKSEDGRRVKWNTFFRADRLSSLTEEDITYFKSLGVKTILDLRSPAEVNGSPDPKIDGVRYINISGMPDLDKETKGDFDMLSIFKQKEMNKFDSDKFLLNGYRNMVFNNKAYKELIDCMENEDRLPIVFHCSAGKDRTGFGAVLILLVLGVTEDKVLEDYLLTNFYRKPINDKIIESIKSKTTNPKYLEALKVMLEVKKEFLDAAFNRILERYGNLETYLEKEFGLTKTKRKELKNRFLY